MRQLREPYATLFEGMENHWLLGQYLWQADPDWQAMLADERLESLSSGERVIVKVAWAIYAGDRSATVADLGILDARTRLRVLRALELTCDQ